MKRIFLVGSFLLFSSGAFAQTVAPSGQTPLARMQEDEVSGSAHQTIENAKKHSNSRKDEESAEEKSTRAAQKRQEEERKDRTEPGDQIRNRKNPQR